MVAISEVETFQEKIKNGINEEHRVPTDIIVGDGCEVLFENTLFEYCLLELISNCSEKDASDITINVHIGRSDVGYTLTVEDNVSYEEQNIDTIIKRLNSKKPGRFGKRRQLPCDDKYIDGEGIRASRRYFEQRGGNLIYRKSEDNRVISEAHWMVDGAQL